LVCFTKTNLAALVATFLLGPAKEKLKTFAKLFKKIE
jgi:hypothetical protein